MKLHSRRLLTAGALTVAGSLLVACSGGGTSTEGEEPPAGDGGSLVVWMDQNRADALGDVIAAFEEETGSTIEVVIKDFGDIRDDFITQAPSGDGPDVVIGAHDWLGKLVQNGVVSPLEFGDAAGDYQEVAISAMSYEGSTYGIPVSIENLALIRNTDLAPTAPATFDELIAMGQESVASGAATSPLLVGLDPNNSDPYHLYPIQASFGGPLFGVNDDGTYNADDLQIGNEGNIQFAQALATYGQQGVLSLNVSQDIAKEQFAAGASPFTITGPWNIGTFDEAGINYEIEAIPPAGDLPATPFVGVQGFYLSSYSENSILATQFLLDYIGSEEAQTAIFETGDRAPALTAAYEAAQSNEVVAAFGAVGTEGVPMPNVPAMDAVWADWGATEAAILRGEGDPAQLWATMAESIQATIDGQ